MPKVSETPYGLVPHAVEFRSSIFRKKCDVIPSDEGVVVFRRSEPRDIVGVSSNKFGGVVTRIVHNAAGYFFTSRADDGYYVAVLELVFNSCNAGIEQARILFGDGVQRAFINVNSAGNRRSESNPAALFGKRSGFSHEQSSLFLTAENAMQDVRFHAVGNERHPSGVHRDAGSLKFGLHASTAAAGFAAGERFDFGGDIVYLRNEFGLGIFTGIIGKETVDIREQNQ